MLKGVNKKRAKKIDESPFVNYFSHSLGMKGIKDIRKENIEPLPIAETPFVPEQSNKNIKHTNTLGSFDFASEFDKLKNDLLITMKDNLQLNIPDRKSKTEIYNNTNDKPVTINKEYNNTKPVTINKEYNNTKPVTINKEYSENRTINKIEKSYPINTLVQDSTTNKSTATKINKIQNTIENSIIKNSKNDKNYITSPITNTLTKNISPSIINTLKPESVINALNIQHPVSDIAPTINDINKKSIANITENKNNNISKKYYYEIQPMMEAFSTLIRDEKEIPVLPGLAKGGLVKNPTQMVVGEAGPEVAIPLDKAPDVIGQSLEKSNQIKSRQTSMSLSENTKNKLDATSEKSEGGEGGGGGNALANNSITSVSAPNIGVGGGGGSKFTKSIQGNVSLPSWRSGLG